MKLCVHVSTTTNVSQTTRWARTCVMHKIMVAHNVSDEQASTGSSRVRRSSTSAWEYLLNADGEAPLRLHMSEWASTRVAIDASRAAFFPSRVGMYWTNGP